MLLTKAARMWLTRSFKPFIFKNEYDHHLIYEDIESLGLYVHIPFCQSVCSFCPYCKVVYSAEMAYNYKKALIKEIDLVGAMSKGKKKVTSLYFGGGTPALLTDYLEEIISTLKKYYVITDGIGVELHPDNVSIDTLSTLKSAGVTKISIGIQSFQPENLQSLGRKEPNYAAVFEALQKVEFEVVSMDLIFAIPGQTAHQLKNDIKTAFANGANHIAVYPFIEFSFSHNKFRPMAEKEKKRLLHEITEYCQQKGYTRTSIWTFAKEGTKKYSSMTRDNFLGFGCSATTLLMDQFKINTFSVQEYIERINQNQLPTSLTLRFSPRQRMIYYLFWTAYTTKVNPEVFEKFFGVSLEKKYGLELFICKLLGFATMDNGSYRMTPRGAYYYHYFEQFYTLAYIDKMWSVMSKTAFPEQITLG